MPNIDWSQVPAIIALIVVFGYIIIRGIDQFGNKHTNEELKRINTELTRVIENNTEALQQVTKLMEVELTRQQGKIDEVLINVRKIPEILGYVKRSD